MRPIIIGNMVSRLDSNEENEMNLLISGTDATLCAEVFMLMYRQLLALEDHMDFSLKIEMNHIMHDSPFTITLTAVDKDNPGVAREFSSQRFLRTMDAKEVVNQFLAGTVADDLQKTPRDDMRAFETRMFVVIQAVTLGHLGLRPGST